MLTFVFNDWQIAVNQEDNLTAYYCAVSGIDMALGIMQQDPEYRGSFSFALEQGDIEVSVENLSGMGGGNWVKISSSGTGHKARERLFLQFQTVLPTPGQAFSGADLGWFDQESGVLSVDAVEQNDSDVFIRSSFCGNTVFAPQDESPYLFSAKSIFFEGDPSVVVEGALVELRAETLIFRGSVILSGEDAGLYLQPAGSQGVWVQFLGPVGSTCSSVLIEPGTYFICEQVSITPTASMSEWSQYRVIPKVPGSKLWGPEIGS